MEVGKTNQGASLAHRVGIVLSLCHWVRVVVELKQAGEGVILA